MAFDLKAFERIDVKRRTEEVPVPELVELFGEDKPVFIVQNLDAPEIMKVEVSAQSNDRMIELVKGLFSKVEKEKINAIQELAGIPADLDPSYIKCLTRIELGLVTPKLDRQAIIKIGKASNEVFYRINQKIKDLSGKGAELGKLQASTKIKK